MIRETVKPSRKGERAEIEDVNCGMRRQGPTEPVSKPLRRPPRETSAVADTYGGTFGGILRLVVRKDRKR